MPWPATVTPGEASTANQYNAVLDALAHWGGDVDAGGFTLSNLGALTVAGAVTFSAPDQIHFGSDWQPWTPTITASGSMTVSIVNLYAARYLRVGPMVYAYLRLDVNLGGTLDSYVYVTLPVPPAATMGATLPMAYLVTPAGTAWSAGAAFVDNSNPRLAMGSLSLGQTFPAGLNGFMVMVVYPC